MIGWVNIIVALVAIASPTARSSADLDALATLRYRSAQTETVAARVADAELSAMRTRIDIGDSQLSRARSQLASLYSAARLDKAKIGALEKQTSGLIAELTSLKTDFTEELARRDAQYARDIAILQTAGEQLLATPEGARALALYNAGGSGSFEAADAVLAQIEKSRDAARAQAMRIQLAGDRRARAELALDARDKGLTTTQVAIDRWEAVVAADAGAAWDWIELCRLYLREQRLDDARRAATTASTAASSDNERAVAFNQLGSIAIATNDLTGAAAALRQALAIQTKQIEAAPDRSNLFNIVVTLVKIGNVDLARGDYPSAASHFDQAVKTDRALLALEPTSADLQRSLMVALFSVGDVRAQRDDRKGAATAYAEAMGLARDLALASPNSISALDDEARGLVKLGDFLLAGGNGDKALAAFDGALAVRRALLQVDPGSAGAQEALATALQRVGDGRLVVADKAGAIAVYEESLVLSRRTAAAAPASAEAQRGLMVALWKLASMDAPGHGWTEVAAQLQGMKAGGLLSPSDAAWLAEAKARAEGKRWP